MEKYKRPVHIIQFPSAFPLRVIVSLSRQNYIQMQQNRKILTRQLERNGCDNPLQLQLHVSHTQPPPTLVFFMEIDMNPRIVQSES